MVTVPVTETRATSFRIGSQQIAPGRREIVELEIPQLYTHTRMVMPVHVVHGRRPGPVLFVNAALHGDELSGVAVIHRLVQQKLLDRVRGTLLAVPVVNVYGFIHQSRYLPDRRDLNRSFPGSERGSLAARLADLFMQEIVSQATHGIDLHSGAIHRTNLPQIRANLEQPGVRELAMEFGAPVVLHSHLRDGSLREAVAETDTPVLLYEAGEALRLDEYSVRTGVRGVINVMRAIGMLPKGRSRPTRPFQPYVSRSSSWVRAPMSGMMFLTTPLGAWVEESGVLGEIVDPFGSGRQKVRAPCSGIVIGRAQIPLTNEGDAVIHIAHGDDGQAIEQPEDDGDAIFP
jgi:uncharacterized protein